MTLHEFTRSIDVRETRLRGEWSPAYLRKLQARYTLAVLADWLDRRVSNGDGKALKFFEVPAPSRLVEALDVLLEGWPTPEFLPAVGAEAATGETVPYEALPSKLENQTRARMGGERYARKLGRHGAYKQRRVAARRNAAGSGGADRGRGQRPSG